LIKDKRCHEKSNWRFLLRKLLQKQLEKRFNDAMKNQTGDFASNQFNPHNPFKMHQNAESFK
jgi:hypothetical protein